MSMLVVVKSVKVLDLLHNCSKFRPRVSEPEVLRRLGVRVSFDDGEDGGQLQ